MELFFLAMLVLTMATALGSGYPVAFALPGSAILTISAAAVTGYLFAGDSAAYFAQGSPSQWLSAGVTNFRGIYWEVERDTLIAIPLFVFMGIMLQRSKIAEDLLVTMAQLFGPIPGGLGISVVFVGALLAATTGILGATVVAMGLISLPVMMRNNYSHSLASGTIAAAGTLGQIIPPSIVLIILADQLSSAVDQADSARKALYKSSTGDFAMPSEFAVTSTSAGDMFLGAFIPGLVLVGLYMLYILVLALARPKLAPAVPIEGGYNKELLGKAFIALVPPLVLIFIVLGSIIAGVATVNQAGAIGAAGAMIMAGYRLREGHRRAYWPALLALASVGCIFVLSSQFSMNVKNIQTSTDALGIGLGLVALAGLVAALIWSGLRTLRIENTLRGVMVETAKTTSLVFIILLGAAMLTAAFRAFGGEDLVREFLTSLPGGFWAQFIIVMAVIFFLGFFLDFIEIAVVVVPIVSPILLADPQANITAVWLGVMIGLNIQTSFLTPPFGFALFYLRGVAPAAVKTTSIYKGVFPFIALQLIALGIVGYLPSLVNYLPMRLSLLGEQAPPPVNPKLQTCMEETVFVRFQTDGAQIKSAIAEAKNIDLSSLPDKLSKSFADSIGKAENTFKLLDDIKATEVLVKAAVPGYAPMHTAVREVQRDIRRDEGEVKLLSTQLSRVRGDDDKAKALRDRLTKQIDAHKASIEELRKKIPPNWEEDHKAFKKLLDADKKARATYRRNTDQSYKPVLAVKEILDAADEFAALRPEVEALLPLVDGGDKDAMGAGIKALSSSLSAVAGTSDIRKGLQDASRVVSRTPDKTDEIKRLLTSALDAYNKETIWRAKASTSIGGKVDSYERTIHDTIGLRSLKRLPDGTALDVAKCMSHHTDVSLSF
jgi:tripartite ATP-independent transporter DctM subunit